MRVPRLGIALAGVLAPLSAEAQMLLPSHQRPVLSNSRGLECRQTRHPTYAYDRPSSDANRVGVVNLFVAVDGPPQGAFLPFAIDGGHHAWVLAKDVVANIPKRSCFVQRLRDGRLLYGENNRIGAD